MQTTQVTIIGGGPTGLLCAINLINSDIKVRIFESRSERSPLSRALAIHAGTLEYLEATHPSLLKKILARGKKIQNLRITEKYELNASLIPSKYNYILLLEQEETEELFEAHLASLGTKVERSCQLVDVRNEERQVIAILKKDDEEFSVTSKYLIDCSGAHSIIRKQILKIPFRGEKYIAKLVMGDVKLRSNLPEYSGYLTGNENGNAAFLPLTSKKYFRIILTPQKDIEIPEKITIEFFQNLCKKMAPEIELERENKWLTSFELSKRMVSKMRVGRIFLAGDAAHIHSPIGGQGMNLGLQDSFNICYKLKRVLMDGFGERTLDNYEKERFPIIIKVLRLTNAAMLSGIEKSLISKIGLFIIRYIVAPIFFRSKFLQKKFFITISQIKSAREEMKRMRLI